MEWQGKHTSGPPKGVSLSVEKSAQCYRGDHASISSLLPLDQFNMIKRGYVHVHSPGQFSMVGGMSHGQFSMTHQANLAWLCLVHHHHSGQFNMTQRVNSTWLGLSFSRSNQHDQKS